jgi:hypothetical protein
MLSYVVFMVHGALDIVVKSKATYFMTYWDIYARLIEFRFPQIKYSD